MKNRNYILTQYKKHDKQKTNAKQQQKQQQQPQQQHPATRSGRTAIPSRKFYNLPILQFNKIRGQPALTNEQVVDALNNKFGVFPTADCTRALLMNLQYNEKESMKTFSKRTTKLGEAANGHLNAAGRQEANKNALIDELINNEK